MYTGGLPFTGDALTNDNLSIFIVHTILNMNHYRHAITTKLPTILSMRVTLLLSLGTDQMCTSQTPATIHS